jgi:hypothetical protein
MKTIEHKGQLWMAERDSLGGQFCYRTTYKSCLLTVSVDPPDKWGYEIDGGAPYYGEFGSMEEAMTEAMEQIDEREDDGQI